MAEDGTLFEARALLAQFRRSSVKSCHIRTGTLEFFASRDPAIRLADAAASASATEGASPALPEATVALRAPHVGTLVRLAPAGSAVAVGEAYGALAVLDEERPLLAEQAGTIVEHRRAAGVLIEHGEELALIAA